MAESCDSRDAPRRPPTSLRDSDVTGSATEPREPGRILSAAAPGSSSPPPPRTLKVSHCRRHSRRRGLPAAAAAVYAVISCSGPGSVDTNQLMHLIDEFGDLASSSLSIFR
ncbi:uncharacterized protein LOC117695972 [Arvicanthis niloticus]|uniref:uncharacterized protein LOC117695972 n=1 Tax=Arvicanthis niloticus TaxID=61156 RepID=UPI00402B8D45